MPKSSNTYCYIQYIEHVPCFHIEPLCTFVGNSYVSWSENVTRCT